MVDSVLSALPSLPSLPADWQAWIVAAIVFAMVFAPIWRLGNSLLNGWTRIHAAKPAKRLERGLGYHNKPGRN